MVPDSLLFIVYQPLTSTNAQMYQYNVLTVPHSFQDVELEHEETHPSILFRLLGSSGVEKLSTYWILVAFFGRMDHNP